jgi:hypothetical protein
MSFSSHAHDLIHAPFTVPDVVHRLGRGLWLYVWLLDVVNAQGLICRNARSIANSLKRPEGEVLDWLGRLVALGLVEVRSPSPHLVLKLTKWSGAPPSVPSDTVEKQHASEQPREVVPVSNSKQAALENIAGVGVPGEGGELTAELAATLGATDAATIAEALADVPDAIVRKALARVRATPAQQIKKSRLALFRYLITRFTHDSSHAHNT